MPNHFRKYYEVIGYVGDGFFVCVDCTRDTEPSTLPPVFLGESDPSDTCDRCTMWLDGQGPDEEE